MKFIIKICLILFCSLQAKTEFDGKWYKLGTNWQIYINITSTSEGQILEQYMKVADNQNLVYSKKIGSTWSLFYLMPFTEYLDLKISE